MKTKSSFIPLILFVLSAWVGSVTGVRAESWSAKELKDPAALAATLADAKASKPIILNIGPVEQIKGAIAIGPVTVQENRDKLKEQMAKAPRDKEVIIYCGCCPFRRCPNLQPAFEQLKKMKFTNVKLLNLPANLKEDWISKGYPME
jgi:thiosulfate/3-mercaptopyruvate sulfurtransferase